MKDINNLKNDKTSVISLGGAAKSIDNVSEYINESLTGRAVSTDNLVFPNQDLPVRTSAGLLDMLRKELSQSEHNLTSKEGSVEKKFVNIREQDKYNLVYRNIQNT